MRKTKWRVIPDDHWNIGMLEAWLEDEASNGWLLVSGGTRLARFERTEPRHCRVRLEPAVPESPAERDAKDEAYRELGWKRICELGEHYQVSVSFDPHAPELQTDPVAESWALEKMLKKEWRNWLLTWPLLLALYAFFAWMLMRTGKPVESLLDANGLVLLLGVAMLPLLVWDTVRSVRGIRALRRQMKAGLPRSHSGSWKRSHRRAVVNFAFFVAIEAGIFCYPVYQIYAGWSAALDNLPQPVPYVEGETLDPSLADRANFLDYCRWETSFLVPDRYEVRELWRGDSSLGTDCDILRFSFLAEALYDEKTAGILADWPEDSVRDLDVPGFDEVTLTRSEGHTVLIARCGKAVLVVNAVGVEGLEAHLSDYAALLAEFQ